MNARVETKPCRRSLAGRPLCPLAAALALCSGQLALAEEPTLATTVVRTEAEQTSVQDQKIDMRRLQRTQAGDLQDIFETEPSVNVGTGMRNGQKVFLRGIEDLNLNVQIDGARQGANLFHHQGRVNVDPYLLKQVTINGGPAPADGGPGALGGSVKFETVDAQDLLESGQRVGGRLGLQLESADDSTGTLGSAYGLVGENLGLLAYVRQQKSRLLRAGGGEKLPATDGQRDSALFKLSLLDQEGHSLWASTEHNANEGGYLRANFPWQTNNLTQALDEQTYRRETYTLRHRYKPVGNGLLNLQTTLYHTDVGIELTGTNPTSGMARGGDWVTKSSGGDVRNTFSFATGHWVHALSLGLDYFRDQGINTGPSTPRLSETATNAGLYLQDRIEIESLRLSGGLRLDRYDTRYANGLRATGSASSPNLSAEWDLIDEGTADVTVFAGYGESIRGGKLNQAGWLTKYFLPPGFTVARPFTFGTNGVLQPERGIQKQWGIKWHDHGVLAKGDHAGVEIAFFNTRIRDYQVVPGEGTSGVTDSIFNAPGDITSRGYEVRSHWGDKQWYVGASYTHSMVRNYDGQPMDTTGDSARVGTSVGDRLIVDTTWQISPAWRLGYTLTAVKRLADLPRGRPRKPGYSVHGVQALWQPWTKDSLTVTVGIDNLLDRRYVQHSTVQVVQASTTATAVAGQTYATPESGRNFKLAVDWRF